MPNRYIGLFIYDYPQCSCMYELGNMHKRRLGGDESNRVVQFKVERSSLVDIVKIFIGEAAAESDFTCSCHVC